MAKTYTARIVGEWRFEVDMRTVKKGKEIMETYIVSKSKGHWNCSCKAFLYSSPLLKTCKHCKLCNDMIRDNPKFFHVEDIDFDWKPLHMLSRRFG